VEKPSVKCALLATMIAKHKWGTPITEDALLTLSAIDGDYPTAREVYADLRRSRTSPTAGTVVSNSTRAASTNSLMSSTTNVARRRGRSIAA
jgi:hypothetical protein